MPRAPTGVSGSGMSTASHCHMFGRIQNRRRPGVVEPLRQRQTVVLVVNPLLADRVADAQHGAPQNLAAKRARMNHRAHVGHGQIIQDVVLAGFEVHFDFGEASDEGMRLAVARHGVASHGQQALPGQRRGRCRREFVDALGQLVAVVDAAEFNRRASRPAPGVMPAPPPLRNTRSLATS